MYKLWISSWRSGQVTNEYTKIKDTRLGYSVYLIVAIILIPKLIQISPTVELGRKMVNSNFETRNYREVSFHSEMEWVSFRVDRGTILFNTCKSEIRRKKIRSLKFSPISNIFTLLRRYFNDLSLKGIAHFIYIKEKIYTQNFLDHSREQGISQALISHSLKSRVGSLKLRLNRGLYRLCFSSQPERTKPISGIATVNRSLVTQPLTNRQQRAKHLQKNSSPFPQISSRASVFHRPLSRQDFPISSPSS